MLYNAYAKKLAEAEAELGPHCASAIAYLTTAIFSQSPERANNLWLGKFTPKQRDRIMAYAEDLAKLMQDAESDSLRTRNDIANEDKIE